MGVEVHTALILSPPRNTHDSLRLGATAPPPPRPARAGAGRPGRSQQRTRPLLQPLGVVRNRHWEAESIMDDMLTDGHRRVRPVPGGGPRRSRKTDKTNSPARQGDQILHATADVGAISWRGPTAREVSGATDPLTRRGVRALAAGGDGAANDQRMRCRQQMMAAVRVMKASWISSRISRRMRRQRNQCSRRSPVRLSTGVLPATCCRWRPGADRAGRSVYGRTPPTGDPQR